MCKETCAKPFESGNEYQSGSNDEWITVEKIRDIIIRLKDEGFLKE